MQVFAKGVDKDTVVLMAARASRLENQDAIDTAIVSMLGDPKEVNWLNFICLAYIFIFHKSLQQSVINIIGKLL